MLKIHLICAFLHFTCKFARFFLWKRHYKPKIFCATFATCAPADQWTPDRTLDTARFAVTLQPETIHFCSCQVPLDYSSGSHGEPDWECRLSSTTIFSENFYSSHLFSEKSYPVRASLNLFLILSSAVFKCRKFPFASWKLSKHICWCVSWWKFYDLMFAPTRLILEPDKASRKQFHRLMKTTLHKLPEEGCQIEPFWPATMLTHTSAL